MTVAEHVFLAPYTTFHIGGPADYFTSVGSQNELIEAIQWARQKGIQFFVLGTGANILVGDKGFRGLVIKNEARNIKVENNHVTAESGTTIAELINLTVQQGLSGFEHFAGIPSSVGGALWQNLHFLSPDRVRTIFISEILDTACIYSEQGETQSVGKEFFKFGYDESILHYSKDVVLSATFVLSSENTSILNQRVAANISWRQEKHPEHATECSAGSVFKKIEGYGAGRLIEKVGLKGMQIGAAKISEKHANFILNTGKATATDVRQLISLVQEKVLGELGLHLEKEISFVGEF
ncbi:MAG: UDP-N-acetylmuramate dehydrogenase [Patescibacteria group bacterium]|nr:UDP-N-acetylmuramate dehydrogenase [Patescibacteria group bacterium]MDE2590782.1 UDP-N-acetylmuramate dehydrogenase [Patescibacteria group bacterium]